MSSSGLLEIERVWRVHQWAAGEQTTTYLDGTNLPNHPTTLWIPQQAQLKSLLVAPTNESTKTKLCCGQQKFPNRLHKWEDALFSKVLQFARSAGVQGVASGEKLKVSWSEGQIFWWQVREFLRWRSKCETFWFDENDASVGSRLSYVWGMVKDLW